MTAHCPKSDSSTFFLCADHRWWSFRFWASCIAALRRCQPTLGEEAFALLHAREAPPLSTILLAILNEVVLLDQEVILILDTVPQRGFSLIMALLRGAREQQIIANVDFEAVSHALLGGLLTYAITSLMSAGEQARPPALERVDALVEVMMRALTNATGTVFGFYQGGCDVPQPNTDL